MNIIFRKTFGEGCPSEKVIPNDKGDFVGIETSTVYSGEEYYAPATLKATVVRIDENQRTGMIHLDSGTEHFYKKQNFVGCTMTFREAHYFGRLMVYQCIETGEYYNQNELNIL